MKRIGLILLVLLLTACQPGGLNAPEAGDPPPSDGVIDQGVAPVAPDPTEAPQPETTPDYPQLELVIAGEEEVVFDWTTDRCEDWNIPDIAARAFRDADGDVNLLIAHDIAYRMTGPDLNNLTMDCSTVLMDSDLDDDPAMFNDAEWIGSLYSPDGQTVYGVVHNEYRGHLHGDTLPDQCPSRDYLTCLDTSLTMVVSRDGGDSFQDIAEAPNHLIATLPYQFDDEGVPSGLRQPSNIIESPDGYFYVLSNISDYPTEEQWACLMRTNNLEDPTSWRYWDGEGFNGVFINPYLEEVGDNPSTCGKLDELSLGAGLVESVTYNYELEKYVAVGVSSNPASPDPFWGVYYSTSDDLINWTRRRLLIELPIIANVSDPGQDNMYAYPVLLDPDSLSINFDTTDDNMYLYMTRAYFGGGSLDRDLVRWPVELVPIVYENPVWGFDNEGETEGWRADNQIEGFDVSGGSLSLSSSGNDPYMSSSFFESPASEYQTVSITMKVSGGTLTAGEIYFLTDTDPLWDENKYTSFDVIVDGEFHTYQIDMSSISDWRGLIQGIRVDPVIAAGLTIEIDRIAIEP